MRRQLESALTIVGAVVGAGFASGREVYQFFSRYGVQGLLGVVLAVMVLFALCVRVLNLARHYRARSLSELMQKHMGVGVNRVLSIILVIALWLGMGVMLSGAGAAGEGFGISPFITIVVTGAVITLCLYNGITGIKRANAILIPILIAVSMYLFWRGIEHGSYSFLLLEPTSTSWLGSVWSAILYAGLNSLLIFVVIPPLSIGGKSTGLWLGCVLIGVLLLGTTFLLLQFPVLSAESPIPMLSIASDVAPRMPHVYGIILWTALTTTALANGLGLQAFVESRLNLGKVLTSAAVVASSLPIALVSFVQLVAVVYTALGFVALVLAGAMFWPSR